MNPIGFIDDERCEAEKPADVLLGYVNIVGDPWAVVRRFDLQEDDGSPVDGLCSTPERTLFVDMNTNARDEAEVIIHEAVEAVNHVLDLQMNHTQVTSVARGLWEAGLRVELCQPQ